MRIELINNDGGGFADLLTVRQGTTAGQLFRDHLGTANPNDYTIAVNGNTTRRDAELSENDRVSITPKKVKGA